MVSAAFFTSSRAPAITTLPLTTIDNLRADRRRTSSRRVWNKIDLPTSPQALLLISLALIPAALSGFTPAEAQLSPQWRTCNPDVDWEQQIKSCTALIQSGRETPANLAIAYYNRGNASRAKGENDRAIADYTKAIEINPKHAKAYNNRGFAYQAKGEVDRAIADYAKAIEINSNYAAAYNNRGRAYEALGKHEEAIADFRRALAIDGNQFSKDGLKRLGASQ